MIHRAADGANTVAVSLRSSRTQAEGVRAKLVIPDHTDADRDNNHVYSPGEGGEGVTFSYGSRWRRAAIVKEESPPADGL